MKKILLTLSVLTGSLINAQDNWINSIPYGFNAGTINFNQMQAFNNKLYLAGDSSNDHIFLYSTSTGDTTTAAVTPENGLTPLLQGGYEITLSSMIANSNYLFMGSGISGYVTQVPQIYRYDKSQYVTYGSINYSSLSGGNQLSSYSPASISNMALYSPTGSNDTIYAFVTPGRNIDSSGYHTLSIWKAPATLTGTNTPTWVNSYSFPFASQITTTYDAIVWGSYLYVTVNSADSGGMILRTKNGSTWDTVLTAAHIQNKIGANYSSAQFTALEIYNHTLVAGISNQYNQGSGGYPLWYINDSTAPSPTWAHLTDSTYSSVMNSWNSIGDLQTANGKLWIQVGLYSSNNSTPAVYYYGKVNGRDTLLHSTGGSNISYEAYYNPTSSPYKLAYFNNNVYSAGTRSLGGSRLNGHNGIAGALSGYATTWRFNMLNPTASFHDSISPGSSICSNSQIYLINTSTNSSYVAWYIDGNMIADNSGDYGTPPYYNTSNPGGIDTIKMIAYNGTNQSYFLDSVTQTITIYPSPNITSVSSTFTNGATYCQGQPAPVQAVVIGGTTPYRYMYTTATAFPLDTVISVNPDTSIILSTVTTGTPELISLTVSDAHNCIVSSNSFTYVYVTAGDSLSGLVTDSNSTFLTNGKVYLFQKKTTNVGQLDTTLIDSLTGTNGKYTFPSLAYGSYYIKAVADTNFYHNAAGTYYADSTNTYKRTAYQWDSALVIHHHACVGGNDTGFNIKVIQVPPQVGMGLITGNISQISGYGMRLANGNNHIMGAPLKGIDVKLGKNPGGGCAARTTSDSAGNYTFNNVNNGSYNIFVDIPNYGMDSVRAVNISSSNPSSVNNNYYVDSNMVRVLPTNVITASICEGDSFQVGTHYHKIAGVFADTVQTASLTDSLVILTLTVNALPTLTLTANNYSICVGSAVTLNVSGAVTYTWSTSANGSAISPTPTVNTTYTVTGTGANNCISKVTQAIMVNALPTITVNTPTICAGSTTTLTASGTATSYTWNSGATTATITPSPTVTTNYTVSGTDANNCMNMQTAQIVVNALPDTSVTITANIITSSATTPATYQWIDCTNNTIISGATNQSYTCSSIGYVAVMVTQNNCTDSSSCYHITTVGVAKIAGNAIDVQIYPNPNNGMFSIETSYQTQCNVFMYDVNGKLVLSQTITNGKADIDASTLNEGVYNISIISKDGVTNKRLVITR